MSEIVTSFADAEPPEGEEPYFCFCAVLRIMALWDRLRPHMTYLKALKAKHKVDIFCGYRSNSGMAGFEVSHRCLGLFIELEVPFGVSVIIA